MKWKEIFYIHPKERISIALLSALVFLYCFGEKKLTAYLLSGEQEMEIILKSLPGESIEITADTCYDINLITQSDLMSLGLSENLAHRWINFRNSMGEFHSLSQIHRIYGLNPEKIEEIIPYLTIGDSSESDPEPIAVSDHPAIELNKRDARKQKPEKAPRHEIKEQSQPKPFCINSAEAEDFKKIRGIGPVLSSRIISYRELLGGFHSPLQLKEVYGVESKLIQKNKKLFEIRSMDLVKVDWKNEEFSEILSHPYTSYEEVVCIMEVRRSDCREQSCLKSCFPPEKWDLFRPYLKKR